MNVRFGAGYGVCAVVLMAICVSFAPSPADAAQWGPAEKVLQFRQPKKHLYCAEPTAELGKGRAVVGASREWKTRSWLWKSTRKGGGKWGKPRRSLSAKRSCWRTLFPGAAYQWHPYGSDGLRIKFGGSERWIWRNKNVFSDHPYFLPLAVRAPDARIAAFAWLEKPTDGRRILRVALVGRGIEGAGPKGVTVDAYEVGPEMGLNSLHRNRTPVAIDRHGNFGIAWIDHRAGADYGKVRFLGRSAGDGTWSGIEEAKGADVQTPTQPGESHPGALHLDFDSAPHGGVLPPVAIAWSTRYPNNSSGGTWLGVRVRDTGGGWLPLRTVQLADSWSGWTTRPSVDLLGDRVAVAWQKHVVAEYYEGTDRKLVTGSASGGELAVVDAGHASRNPDIGSRGFIMPILLTGDRVLVLAGDETNIAARLYRSGAPKGSWRYVVRLPFLIAAEQDLYYYDVAWNPDLGYSVYQNRRVGLAWWDARKNKGVMFREFK